MKKSFLILSLFLLCATVNLFAQDTLKKSSETKYKFGIGAGAGLTTGYGLSFRYHAKKIGGQINFAPYKNNETEQYSVGATFIYMLTQNKIANLYLYQGNHYYYSSQVNYIYDKNNPEIATPTRYKESYVNNGIGFGIEIIIVKNIGFNLMGGYGFRKNFTEINVTGETALYYKF